MKNPLLLVCIAALALLAAPAFAQGTPTAPLYKSAGGSLHEGSVDKIMCSPDAGITWAPCSSTGGGGSSGGTATAANPTYTEGATGQPLSIDLSGRLRTLSTISGLIGIKGADGVTISGPSNGFSVLGTKLNDGTQSSTGGTHLTMGGIDTGTNVYRPLLVDSSGRPITVGAGVAGTPAGGVVTVQGAASMTALKVDGSAVTQPVSGTVAATQATASSLNAQVVGNTAAGSAFSSNPLVAGCKSNSGGLTTVSANQAQYTWCGTSGQTVVSTGNNNSIANIVAGSSAVNLSFAPGGGTNPFGVLPYLWNSTSGLSPIGSAANGVNSTGAGIAAVQDIGQCDDTSIQAITENSFGNLRQSCNNHALVVVPYETGPNSWSYVAASGGISNTTTAVTIKAADATRPICLLSLQLSAGTLGAATEVAIRDGAGGTVLWRGYMTTAGGYQPIKMEPPLCGTANTLMEVVTLTATVSGPLYVNAQGFVRP